MKVVRFSKAESYEPEKDWKRVSLIARRGTNIPARRCWWCSMARSQ
jgi:hypothetical protein